MSANASVLKLHPVQPAPWHGLRRKRNTPALLAKVIVALAVFGALDLLVYAWAIRPWYMRWGATDAEVSMTMPGDELVPVADKQITHAVTIYAPASEVFPWLKQLGWERGGLYSYEWLENLAGLGFVNADRIHAEWQNTQVGDKVSMGPEGRSPLPYIVAQILPDRAVILGHRTDDGEGWVESWQFVLNPIDAHRTRLMVRTRSSFGDPTMQAIMTGVEPFAFMMERGMLLGIKARAERNAANPMIPPCDPVLNRAC